MNKTIKKHILYLTEHVYKLNKVVFFYSIVILVLFPFYLGFFELGLLFIFP